MFEVHCREHRGAVGVVGLCHWSPRDRTAETSFYLGVHEMRRRGLIRRALRLMHAWGFDELGLDRIWAEVYAFNDPGARVLESLGFVREGTLRDHVWRRGRRWDAYMYGLMRDEVQ